MTVRSLSVSRRGLAPNQSGEGEPQVVGGRRLLLREPSPSATFRFGPLKREGVCRETQAVKELAIAEELHFNTSLAEVQQLTLDLPAVAREREQQLRRGWYGTNGGRRHFEKAPSPAHCRTLRRRKPADPRRVLMIVNPFDDTEYRLRRHSIRKTDR